MVAALVAVNSAGRPGDPSTTAVSRARAALAAGQQTVIGLVATNARLDKLGCLLVAQGAHDGLARAVFPPHTSVDGDAFVAAATGAVAADPDTVRMLAVHVVADAIGSLAGRGRSGGAG